MADGHLVRYPVPLTEPGQECYLLLPHPLTPEHIALVIRYLLVLALDLEEGDAVTDALLELQERAEAE